MEKSGNQRQPKGSVNVRAKGRRLFLYWTYQGKRIEVAAKQPNTPKGRARADALRIKLQDDLDTGNLDPTLIKYGLGRSKAVNYDGLASQRHHALTIQQLFKNYQQVKCGGPKYSAVLKRLPNTLLKDFDSGRAVLEELSTLKPETQRTYLGLLNACWEYFDVNPNPWTKPATAKFRRSRKKPQPFTTREVTKIIQYFQQHRPKYYLFVLFLFGTGARPCELLNLTWANVNENSINLHSNKTGCSRTLFLNTTLANALGFDCPDVSKVSKCNFVFPRIDLRNFRNRVWITALKNLNIPYRRPYTARHTFVQNTLDSTKDPIKTAYLTGHSTQTMFQHYYLLVPNKDRATLPDFKY